MLTVTIDQSEGISGADIPEQAVKKMRTGSAALSLPSPRAFFAFLFTERHYLGAWNRLGSTLIADMRRQCTPGNNAIQS